MLAVSLTSKMPTRHCAPRAVARSHAATMWVQLLRGAPEAGTKIADVVDPMVNAGDFTAAELTTPVPLRQVFELFCAAPVGAPR